MNFQAILMRPASKKTSRRLREMLNQLYSHLDNSAHTVSGGEVGTSDKLNFNFNSEAFKCFSTDFSHKKYSCNLSNLFHIYEPLNINDSSSNFYM